MTYSLEPERKALITGGASGFGLAIARALAAGGATVGLLDVDEARLESAAAELGDRAVSLRADVRSEDEVAGAVRRFAESAGGLDTLVLCAGVIQIKPLAELSAEEWRRTLDINLTGAFLVAKAAAPRLAASGRGRIVSLSSDAGRRGMAMIAAYSSSKFGLIGLTESLAMELAGEGVTANCVCPVGCPTTEMGKSVLSWKVEATGKEAEEVVADAGAGNPLGRNATEADVTSAVMFFLSPEASFLTGVSLDVDGGLRLGGALPGAG
jgi:meso-butanediol dehydrogenase/(S,S)-butanediol dehydrogenase/diacetyl reductase